MRLLALLWLSAVLLVAQPVEGVQVQGAWPAALGNHRWVLKVAAAGVVRVRIPWRRTDADPAAKGLKLQDPTGADVPALLRLKVDADAADLAFEAPVAGTYHLYPLAHTLAGSPNYPKAVYLPREAGPSAAWLARTGLKAGDPTRAEGLPQAEVTGDESRRPEDAFNALDRGATAAEREALLAKRPEPFLAFTADRSVPLRQTRALPEPWARVLRPSFRGEARPGEFYPFQISVWAARRPIVDLKLTFSDLVGPAGVKVPAAALRCFNLGGVDVEGRAFTKPLHVDRGRLQALWIGVDLAMDLNPGAYTGTVLLRDAAGGAQRVTVRLDVAGAPRTDHGDAESWRLSRLRWLDSRLAQGDGLVAPYTALRRQGRTLRLLGRELDLADSGWPAQVRTRFAPSLTSADASPRELLAAPAAFEVLGASGVLPVRWQPLRWGRATAGAAEWSAQGACGDLRLTLQGRLEFDGTLEARLQVRAQRPVDIADLRLRLPLQPAFATHLMGLGHRGGRAPQPFTWRWNRDLNQDALWVGAPSGGVQLTLKDDTYRRPLNTNFYLEQPLRLPDAWHNGGQGGVSFDGATVTAFGGPRSLAAGQMLRFHARLMFTPFRPVDTDAQWRTRFLHAYRSLADAKATGATVLNIHHATAVNPWINYPFLTTDTLKAYVDGAHAQGQQVKLYYTVRELTTKAPELPALRSLGDEVISPGPGGGSAWLQEHLEPPYLAAWHVPEIEDAAMVTSGVSRWHNHYVEGLDFLVRTLGVDGLYLDDLAFDRTTMKRLRRVLDQGGRHGLLDLHSANQFNARDGFASSANLYLEHFPYLDRLWFGEYFDYDMDPDQWLIEMSGLPFGLMGEMLQDGGNPWRGMVFGMTNRLPWEKSDPRPLWKEWDRFGMAGARMVGWWDPACPVRVDHGQVKATAYVQKGRTLIALASWAKEPVTVAPRLDWAALGLDPAKATLRAHPIERFQEARTFQPGEAIPLAPGKGWLLEVRD
ncbi:MAG TPA: glycoside hydrolase domain-containing protein [Holophagaceae bacterium]|nr:glycoside hydrolase domain-containing protein [Holophagaceae bacterium]